MKPFGHARLASQDSHSAYFEISNGSSLKIQALEASMVRVTFRPASGYREPRTWAIAPQAGADVAWTGRAR